MSQRDPALEPFDQVIGTWDVEATHPMFEGAAVEGTTTFEWLDGGHFVVMRSKMEHEAFPDGISVIGRPEEGEGLVMEYFDSRGVRRTYGIAIEDGVLRIWRDDPEFAQRLSAQLAPDEFAGTWELARVPGEWKEDLAVTYRRRS